MTTQHTPTPWHAHLSEMGGYDCMTDAWFIKSGAESLSRTIATLDFSDYGQKSCGPASLETMEAIKADAAFIVRAINNHDALIEAMKRAADMLPANAACGILRAALAKAKES